MDIHKMMTNGIFTMNGKYTQSENEPITSNLLESLMNLSVHLQIICKK